MGAILFGGGAPMAPPLLPCDRGDSALPPAASRKRYISLAGVRKGASSLFSCNNGEAAQPLLPAQHDQAIGAVRHAAPLRVVVGLELPCFAGLGHQDDLATLEPPLHRAEGGD